MIADHAFVATPDGDCQSCPLPEAHPVHVPALPETPYAGSSGWSGSETSRERAERADADGTTSTRQAEVLSLLAAAGREGMTWNEVGAAMVLHHGSASGTLSVLHKRGLVARLRERRSRSAIYVLPDHVAGRETAEQGRQAADPDVVKREEWSIFTASGMRQFMDSDDPEQEARTLARPTDRVQRRTVITTPWEDA